MFQYNLFKIEHYVNQRSPCDLEEEIVLMILSTLLLLFKILYWLLKTMLYISLAGVCKFKNKSSQSQLYSI